MILREEHIIHMYIAANLRRHYENEAIRHRVELVIS